MKTIRLLGAAPCAAVLLLVGCSGSTSESTSSTQQTASSTETSALQPVPLVIANWDETERLMAAERGKVVVLDLWATW